MDQVHPNLINQINQIRIDKYISLYFWIKGDEIMTTRLSDGFYLLVADTPLGAVEMLRRFQVDCEQWTMKYYSPSYLDCVREEFPQQQILGYLIWSTRKPLKLVDFVD